ncbi:hypothetical protein C8J57DRAFT_1480824 [Mycena rebaudengoi]|nr:hypothetical protein C8J57DRAFT_1480824 [Mycena rebaudengoi]
MTWYMESAEAVCLERWRPVMDKQARIMRIERAKTLGTGVNGREGRRLTAGNRPAWRRKLKGACVGDECFCAEGADEAGDDEDNVSAKEETGRRRGAIRECTPGRLEEDCSGASGAEEALLGGNGRANLDDVEAGEDDDGDLCGGDEPAEESEVAFGGRREREDAGEHVVVRVLSQKGFYLASNQSTPRMRPPPSLLLHTATYTTPVLQPAQIAGYLFMAVAVIACFWLIAFRTIGNLVHVNVHTSAASDTAQDAPAIIAQQAPQFVCDTVPVARHDEVPGPEPQRASDPRRGTARTRPTVLAADSVRKQATAPVKARGTAGNCDSAAVQAVRTKPLTIRHPLPVDKATERHLQRPVTVVEGETPGLNSARVETRRPKAKHVPQVPAPALIVDAVRHEAPVKPAANDGTSTVAAAATAVDLPPVAIAHPDKVSARSPPAPRHQPARVGGDASTTSALGSEAVEKRRSKARSQANKAVIPIPIPSPVLIVDAVRHAAPLPPTRLQPPKRVRFLLPATETGQEVGSVSYEEGFADDEVTMVLGEAAASVLLDLPRPTSRGRVQAAPSVPIAPVDTEASTRSHRHSRRIPSSPGPHEALGSSYHRHPPPGPKEKGITATEKAARVRREVTPDAIENIPWAAAAPPSEAAASVLLDLPRPTPRGRVLAAPSVPVALVNTEASSRSHRLSRRVPSQPPHDTLRSLPNRQPRLVPEEEKEKSATAGKRREVALGAAEKILRAPATVARPAPPAARPEPRSDEQCQADYREMAAGLESLGHGIARLRQKERRLGELVDPFTRLTRDDEGR